MGWQKDLRKASEDGLTDAEIRSINRQYDITSEEIRKKATEKNYNYIGTPAETTTPYAPGGTTSTSPGTDPQNLQSFYQNLYDFQLGITQAQGAAQTNSTTIRAEADKEIAKIDADSRKYGYDLGLQGTKYTADKESEWRQAIANIEVKGKLDLQPIINAGLQRVAEIEGQSAKDVAGITGGYNLRSMQERTAADKALGQMQLAGGMYGLIGAAFG